RIVVIGKLTRNYPRRTVPGRRLSPTTGENLGYGEGHAAGAPGSLRRPGRPQRLQGCGFRVVGYYFQSRVEDCKRRTEQRPAGRQVPLRGLLDTAGRMELPSPEEGFDELFYVRIEEGGAFMVEGVERGGGKMKFDELDDRMRVFETAHDLCVLPGLHMVA